MADIKTHLREISFAITIGKLKKDENYYDDFFNPESFYTLAKELISNDVSDSENIYSICEFSNVHKQIIINGIKLGKTVYYNDYFKIDSNSDIFWYGHDTQKEDPVDVKVGDYGFSLKEESFILENMSLAKLLNCFTGSSYAKRHIFSDYARAEYEKWFEVTWNCLLSYLNKNNNTWSLCEESKKRIISKAKDHICLLFEKDGNNYMSNLPIDCSLSDYEKNTTGKIREGTFAKFIKNELAHNSQYNKAKRDCAVKATSNLAKELNNNINYESGLPRFLRIHDDEYYYAKTTAHKIEIYKVPSIENFTEELSIESIESSVPETQANILTTIKNKKTGNTLILRNECRFSHGQFNGTPEAKLYYNGSLEVIYKRI